MYFIKRLISHNPFAKKNNLRIFNFTTFFYTFITLLFSQKIYNFVISKLKC